jgi:hypothetical protein
MNSELINSKEGYLGDTESKLDCDPGETAEADCPRSEAEDPPDVSSSSLKRKCSDSESDMSTDAENRLVIDCSDSDRMSQNISSPTGGGGKNVPLKSSQNNNVQDIRITRSKAMLLAKMSYVNQTLCQKPMQSVTNRDHEMDNMSCEDTPKSSDSSDLGKLLENVTSSGCSGIKENTSCSEVTNKMSEDTAMLKEDHATSMSIRNPHDCSAVDAEEQEKRTRGTGLNPPSPGFNVSYRLWKLSKDEGQPGDRKEGFLKGDYSNREIKVLVRCKVDGHEVNI